MSTVPHTKLSSIVLVAVLVASTVDHTDVVPTRMEYVAVMDIVCLKGANAEKNINQ